MRNRLHIKRILTVGFVGKGDNPPAELTFFKRHDPANAEDGVPRQVGEAEEPGEGFRGQADPAADLSGAVKSNPTDGVVEIPEANAKSNPQERVMDEKFPTLKAVLKALGFTREDVVKLNTEELANGLDGGEKPDPEPAKPVEKSAEVVALEKAVQAAQERADAAEALAKQLEDQREGERFQKEAEQYEHLPGVEPSEFGAILRKCAGALGEDEYAKLGEILRGADEAARQGQLFKEIGTDAAAEGSVESEVQKLADEIKKAKPELTDTMARAEVWKSRPDLMNRYEQERAARAARRGATEE